MLFKIGLHMHVLSVDFEMLKNLIFIFISIQFFEILLHSLFSCLWSSNCQSGLDVKHVTCANA